MKTTINIFLALLILLAFTRCNDDFLNQEDSELNTLITLTDTLFMLNISEDQYVSMELPTEVNAHWRIAQFPWWLELDPVEGDFVNGKSSFNLRVRDSSGNGQWAFMDLSLVFHVDGVGLVEYPLFYGNLGYPQVYTGNSSVYLDTKAGGTIPITNGQGGILLWEVISAPSWLAIDTPIGALDQNQEGQIPVRVLRDNLAKGDYTGTVKIWTNSFPREFEINVHMRVSDPVLTGTTMNINGQVTGADYCQKNKLLVVATKEPNQLYFFKEGEASRLESVSAIPTGLSLSENGDSLVVGFSNTDVSVFNTQNRSVISTKKCGLVPVAVALGGNGWAYLSAASYESPYLHSMNLSTGEYVVHKENMRGMKRLMKVPGMKQLVGNQTGWSPDRIAVFDISDGAANDTVKHYYLDAWDFWLSDDGANFFCGRGQAYQTIPYLGIDEGYLYTPPLVGEFERTQATTTQIVHNSVIDKFFVAEKAYRGDESARVYQFDATGYFKEKTYLVNDCEEYTSTGINYYHADVPYLFITADGETLILVKEGRKGSDKGYWVVERVPL